jgi:hypothetical protein
MFYNVLLHEYTRHTRTFPSLTDLEAAARQTSMVYAPLLKQLLGLKNARWISAHEVNVCMSLDRHVPLGRLQEFL